MIKQITVGDIFKNNEPALKKIYDVLYAMDKIARNFKIQYGPSILDTAIKLNALTIRYSPQIIEFINRMQPIIKSMNSMQVVGDQGIRDYIEKLKTQNLDSGFDNANPSIDDALEQIDNEIVRAKFADKLPIDARVNILIFIIQMIWSLIQSSDSEQQQKMYFEKLVQINQTINDIKGLNERDLEVQVYYYTMRSSKVMLSPKSKTIVIATVRKGSVVERIAENKKWIKIHFNSSNGAETVGWVLKKYFNKIE